MGAGRSIMGIGTSAFMLFLYWVTWPYTNNILNSPTDTVQQALYWGSFAVIILTTLILIPYLIMTKEEDEMSILNSLSGTATWAVMLVANLIIFPGFNALIGIFEGYATGNGPSQIISYFQEGTFIIQFFSFLYLLVAIMTLYVLPFMMSVNPSIAKRVIGGTNG